MHTKTPWSVVNHPVFDNPIIMGELNMTVPDRIIDGKALFKGKAICELWDVRGDSFERLEKGEKKANAEMIVKAVNNHDALRFALVDVLAIPVNTTTMSTEDLQTRIKAIELLKTL